MLTKDGSKYNPPRTFAIVERNKVPSPLLLARRPELKQERQLLERLSYRHWKAISMRVGIGLGDTYGPMHYPGMRSLWQSPANFHQHLAFPPPFPSPGPPTWFLFLLLPLQTLLACYCPRMVTINRKGGVGKLYCPASMAQSWRCAITLYCFPSWWNWLLILLGEKMSLTLLCWCSYRQNSGNTQRPKTTDCKYV